MTNLPYGVHTMIEHVRNRILSAQGELTNAFQDMDQLLQLTREQHDREELDLCVDEYMGKIKEQLTTDKSIKEMEC